jgi:predicted nucleic acid-binding protein
LAGAISNTSPLQYLHQLGRLEILPALAGGVVIPKSVEREIEAGRRLGVSLPDTARCGWLHVAEDVALSPEILAWPDLGMGERAVLALAHERAGGVAVLDDNEARRCAKQLGVRVTGTLGLLMTAHRAGLIAAVRPEFNRLKELGFHFAPVLRQRLLREANED